MLIKAEQSPFVAVVFVWTEPTILYFFWLKFGPVRMHCFFIVRVFRSAKYTYSYTLSEQTDLLSS